MRRSNKSAFGILHLLLLGVTSCSTEAPDKVLPPITTIGAHTFGCLVDGAVWLPNADGDNNGVLDGSWFLNEDDFGFSVMALDNEKNEMLNIVQHYVQGTGTYQLNPPKVFAPFVRNDNIYHILRGTVTFSRIDSTHAAGTFEYVVAFEEDTVEITEGRFDL
jgi:hypothetical protein